MGAQNHGQNKAACGLSVHSGVFRSDFVSSVVSNLELVPRLQFHKAFRGVLAELAVDVTAEEFAA